VLTGEQNIGRWQFGRTVIEGLILAGIIYLASSTGESSRATIKLNEQLVALTAGVGAMGKQLDNVQGLALDLAKTDVRLDEHERRIGTLEQARVREALRNGK
jgi:hypothetical protein